MSTFVLDNLVLDNKADLVSTEDLAQILHSFLSPAQSQQHFRPRDTQVREIEEALEAPGRTIFLYGDRAPGNTLAQTFAAYGLPGDDAVPKGCSSTFTVKAGHHRNDHNEDIVLVIDQFDEITSEAERTRFADFIQQIGDRNLPLRFVLCGVSESVKTLLKAHESCYSTTDFTWPSREGKVEVVETTRQRLSHGSPHYAHLMPERLFWEMFNDPTFARSLI
jgi:hypothetical protein